MDRSGRLVSQLLAIRSTPAAIMLSAPALAAPSAMPSATESPPDGIDVIREGIRQMRKRP